MRPTLTTAAIVLQRHPAADKFQRLVLFSPEHGCLAAMQRLNARPSQGSPLADLFEMVQVRLESGRYQGETVPGDALWFIRESRLLTGHPGIARSYDALRLASEFANLVARNPVANESFRGTYELLCQCLAAFASGTRPDVAAFKSVYLFVRNEGYPLRQEWIATLSPGDRATVEHLLSKPLSEQSIAADDAAQLYARLIHYLRTHTELQV